MSSVGRDAVDRDEVVLDPRLSNHGAAVPNLLRNASFAEPVAALQHRVVIYNEFLFGPTELGNSGIFV